MRLETLLVRTRSVVYHKFGCQLLLIDMMHSVDCLDGFLRRDRWMGRSRGSVPQSQFYYPRRRRVVSIPHPAKMYSTYQALTTRTRLYNPYTGAPTFSGPGFRLPFYIVSPWTRGKSVFTEMADHSSQTLFLEKWLAAKGQPFKNLVNQLSITRPLLYRLLPFCADDEPMEARAYVRPHKRLRLGQVS